MTDRDRLIELIQKEVPRPKADALAIHLLANGVIVPPVKYGDEIYYLFSVQGVKKAKVRRIQIGKYGVAIFTKYGATLISEIGKAVFLTKEEAEQALKELKNE